MSPDTPETELHNDCTIECPNTCSWVFNRVKVYVHITGGTRVEWEMHSRFSDPLPHSFQLQVGRTGSNNSSDWVNVGTAVTNRFYATDDSQRVFGKDQWTHYRVKVVTSVDTYYSKPELATGALSHLDWRRAKEILRLERLRFRKAAGISGYLLKRKNYGEECSCLDSMTREPTIPNHPECFGTGYVNGYWEPVECNYVEFMPSSARTTIDLSRGTVNDRAVSTVRMLTIPKPDSRDIWVDADSDIRWEIQTIQEVAEIRGVTLVAMAEFRQLPFSDVAYTIPLE